MSKRMKMVLGLALMVLVAIGIVWVGRGFENGQPASHASRDIPATWCQEFTDDPHYEPTRPGWCYRLTGTVATVLEETSNLTIVEVDHGEPILFEVAMRPECNVWQQGDRFAQTVRLSSLGPVLRCE